MNNLYEKYKKEVVPALMKEMGYKSLMEVPKIKKVVINVGVGRFLKEPNYIENVEKNLVKITGQKTVRTKAKKAISNFKIREGMEIGVVVTMRGPRMYYFLEKLLNVTFPRMRDFHGISDKGFDKQGNFTIGFKENMSFPEIKSGELDKSHGMEITINSTTKSAQEGRALLTHLGFPFVK
ncbi:MAG: 50S ribosomal protein L5 [Candidatus Magasanikbacteria bacterium CG10_big_fil_rev_8_21_14_0_10_36_32]|uniref:Large ribosomal subunit protein uL5 n=1 Tax=Candidatus Magasanikbacteria bacterium CG10_big_fil_rev_8_21_14_0_10_36_32 TaxID=1974646 RepID=A0A2M6W7D8_9BACT|nr:MAG: 50S ribosomal protein L5 [Candidatus Magasanikbacteria bacterium CG10_big_fil_rev_8_21_14_0_10_36_32]